MIGKKRRIEKRLGCKEMEVKKCPIKEAFPLEETTINAAISRLWPAVMVYLGIDTGISLSIPTNLPRLSVRVAFASRAFVSVYLQFFSFSIQ